MAYSGKKHIARSGAKAGQWVNCTAVGECRLGGQHISEQTYYATRAWLEENGSGKKATEVSAADVDDFTRAGLDPVEWGRKAEDYARKAKALPEGHVVFPFNEDGKPVSGRRSLNEEDFATSVRKITERMEAAGLARPGTVAEGNARARALKDKATAARKPAPVASKPPRSVMTLSNYEVTQDQYDELSKSAKALGVEIQVGEKQKAFHYKGFKKTYRLSEMKFLGKKEDVEGLTARLKQMQEVNPTVVQYGSGRLNVNTWRELNALAARMDVQIGHKGWETYGLLGRNMVISDLQFLGTPSNVKRLTTYFDQVKNL